MVRVPEAYGCGLSLLSKGFVTASGRNGANKIERGRHPIDTAYPIVVTYPSGGYALLTTALSAPGKRRSRQKAAKPCPSSNGLSPTTSACAMKPHRSNGPLKTLATCNCMPLARVSAEFI